MKLYPLKMRPVFKERIWGGRKLATAFGKDLPAGRKIGESWEVADLPEGKCEVADGPLAGWTIDRLIEQYGADFTGRDSYKPPFPLLIKILDAEDVLSVQVHPDPETVRRMGKGDPKTECWYIIEAAPGAVIYKGLRPGVKREQFEQAIEAGTTADLLEKVEVKPGECHFLPAGTAHAIGAGLLIAEIQTPSDTTYRVFDWNRVDEAGRSRQLHIQEALESIHFDTTGRDLPVRTSGRLVDSDVFKVDKLVIPAGESHELIGGRMRAAVFVNGQGTLQGGERQPTVFARADTFLLPACMETVIRADTPCDLLIATP